MIKTTRHIIQWKLSLLIGCFCLFAVSAIAQQMPQVDIRIEPKTILIGEWVELHVSVNRDPNTELFWSTFEKELVIDSARTLEILEESAIDTSNAENNRLVEHRKYTITAWDTGTYLIPPIKVGFKSNNKDSLHTVQSYPALLTVVPVAVDAKEPIKPIKDLQDMPFRLVEWKDYFIFGGLALLLIVVVIVLIIVFKPKPKPIEEKPIPKDPAHVIALQKLNALNQQKLWQGGNEKLYYSELTDILREYLELRYDFYAMESTTSEILTKAQKLAISKQSTEYLATVFTRADLVKFAKQLAYTDEHVEAMQLSIKFVEQTQQQQREDA